MCAYLLVRMIITMKEEGIDNNTAVVYKNTSAALSDSNNSSFH